MLVKDKNTLTQYNFETLLTVAYFNARLLRSEKVAQVAELRDLSGNVAGI